jgi:DNA-binding beta-propeller fold protein YncE
MRLCTAVLLSASLLLATPGHSQSPASGDQALRLVQTFSLPADIKGGFDHFGVDLKRDRLFATAQVGHAVLVIDIRSGKLLTRISDVVRPHAVFYRSDLDRLYVTDGGDGSVKIYDAANYHLLQRVPLQKNADSIGYDISRKYLYVDNGGKDIGKTYSMFSGIDTTSAATISEMKVQGDTLEAMALDNYRPHIYVNDKATNQVVVIDRLKNRVLAKWPVTLGSQNVAMALDEQRQRLFIGCRSGQIVVLDSNTGKELQSLPIAKGIDDLIYDPQTRRIYAAANGQIDVYEQADLNHYVSLGGVPSSLSARTERLVPELNRLVVAAPAQGSLPARVLVYEPTHLPPVKAAVAEVQEPVHAPGPDASLDGTPPSRLAYRAVDGIGSAGLALAVGAHHYLPRFPWRAPVSPQLH